MLCSYKCSHFILLCTISFVIASTSVNRGVTSGSEVLYVGKERWRETLPLQSGARLYRLEGLKSHTWYEVKISYPASIPATFSLQLKHGDKDMKLHPIRRLLNTEKLIFNTEARGSFDEDGLYVLVAVEPEGVVAIPHVEERDFIIYNIVCDELLLGIPHKAWPVVAIVLLCLIAAFVVPRHLPSYLLLENRSSQLVNQNFSKHS